MLPIGVVEPASWRKGFGLEIATFSGRGARGQEGASAHGTHGASGSQVAVTVSPARVRATQEAVNLSPSVV
jgi:hypothetical protein